MKHIFTMRNKQRNNCITRFQASLALIIIAAIMSIHPATAQEVLTALTSTGGAEGRGTAFSIKTNGSGFAIINSFADWGKTPNGDLLANTDGLLYGMTSTGGTYNSGTIFSITTTGAINIIRHLNSVTDGATPHGELIRATDGNFYGLTSGGGTNTYGTIFRLSPDGVYTVLRHLSYATDGTNPRGHLVQAKDGNFYGMTYGGGPNGTGTIFRITPAGTFTVIKSFNKTTDGGNSYGSLTEGKDGLLYGMTYSGGSFGYGTIFKITTSGTYTVIRHLNSASDGAYPQGDLIQASDGNFYGVCYSGGSNGNGTIFKLTTAGAYTVLRHLSASLDGGNPFGNLYQHTDGFLYGMNRTGGAKTSGTAYRISTSGAFTLLHSFVPETEGATPNGGFVRGGDGNLYGFTSSGGATGGGVAIKMNTSGAVTILTSFDGSIKGNAPYETLIKGRDSAYYGTVSNGGLYGYGAIIKICGGTTTPVYSFNRNADGGTPKGSLLLASDGNFYGMTSDGGSKGYGTIFRLTPKGAFGVLYHFNGPVDGGFPQGSLIQGTDGFLYGITNSGGTNGGGTIFKISLAGVYTVLRHLSYATDGANAEGSLVQGTDGSLYGMTSNNGRIFKITTTGTFTILRTLISSTDGAIPTGSLVLGRDGNFYGMTSSGGSFSGGTIFSISPTGTFKTLKHLNPVPDGKSPRGDLYQGKDGNFYGMTNLGGNNNLGTIFRVSTTGTFTVLRHFTMFTDGGNPFGGFVAAPINNLVANPQSVSTVEDTKKTITLSGSGGAPLTFNITTPPRKGKLTGTGANRTYSPNANYSGKDSFAFSVSVGCIASTPAVVRITVSPVADSPVLAAIGNKTVVKNNTLTFTAKATDPDKGQAITYSLIGAPAGAAIHASTGVFTWTPTTTGNFTFTVRASDNGVPALYDQETITVSVTAAAALLQTEVDAVTADANKLAVSIFPNPVESRIMLTIENPEKEVLFRIVDMNGIVVHRGTMPVVAKQGLSIMADHLKPGTYILHVQSGNASASCKFLKK